MSLTPRMLAIARSNPAVVVLVGLGLVLAALPLTNASHLGTGGPDVRIDVRNPLSTVTIHNGTAMVFSDVYVPSAPAAFKMRAQTSYELSFVGLNITAGGYGHTNATGDVEIINASSGAVVATAQPLIQGPDGVGGTLRNATLFITPTSVQGPGLYQLRPVSNPAQIAAQFVFFPHDDIAVTITTNPTPLVYSTQQAVISVQTGVAGATISSNAPGLIPSPATTDGSGNFVFVSGLPMGAGSWTVYAARDNNPGGPQLIPGTSISMPERLGNATLTVLPSNLSIATVTPPGDPATPIAWRPSYASTGDAVFASANGSFLADNGVDRFTLEVQAGASERYVFNETMIDPSSNGATFSPACFASNGTPSGCSPSAPTLTLATANGNLTLAPGPGGWMPATYSLALGLEAAGGASSPAEYAASWGFTTCNCTPPPPPPSAPLRVTVSPSVLPVGNWSNLTVHVSDQFGNAVASANVELLRSDGSLATPEDFDGERAVYGSGAPGKGANGDYVLALRALHPGDFFARASQGNNSTSALFSAGNATAPPCSTNCPPPPNSTAAFSIGHYNGSVLHATRAPIVLRNASDFGSATVTLRVNTSVVDIVNVSPGNINGSNTTWFYNRSTGTLTVLITTTAIPSVSGDFVFAYVWLDAVGSAGSVSALDLEVVELTDSVGNALLASATDGSFRAGLLGDVDNNGVLDLLDVDAMGGVVVGARAETSIVRANADINRDGRITGVDAMMLRQYLAGTRASL